MEDDATSPRPITSSAAALGWALRTLRDVADPLEAAPRKLGMDALAQLVPTLRQLEERAAVVLPSAAPRAPSSRAIVLCFGPREGVAAVRAKADDLFGGAAVSSLTEARDQGRTAFHIVNRIETSCRCCSAGSTWSRSAGASAGSSADRFPCRSERRGR